MSYALIFIAGALLCNCIPHLATGLQGAPFPTPFAKPRGVGNSPPIVNFVWGAANLFVGLYLLSRHPVALAPSFELLTLALGFLAIGISMSLHFGGVMEKR